MRKIRLNVKKSQTPFPFPAWQENSKVQCLKAVLAVEFMKARPCKNGANAFTYNSRTRGLKMKDTSVEKEILLEIHKLGKGQQAEVLEFVRSLTKTEVEGVAGKTLLRFAGTIDIKDLDKMAEAVQADCESVNPNEW